MRYLLDANICIILLAGVSERLTERILSCDEGDLVTSSVAFAEVAWGSWNGKLPPVHVLDGFAREVAVLPFDEGAARQYARLPFRRGNFDRLIAAHALALDLTLVTNNEADFADIANLRLENWTL